MKGFLKQDIEATGTITIPAKTPCEINALTKEDYFSGGVAANLTFKEGSISDHQKDLTINVFADAVGSDDVKFQMTVDEFKASNLKVTFW